MSKLYKTYKNLKQNNPNKIYLFKSGMFYIGLQEDAQKLSDIFGFKITKLNEEVNKVGFPINRLEYYSGKLDVMDNVKYEIVDSNYGTISNYNDYLNNVKLKNITDSILKLDLDNTTFRQAFDFLGDIKGKLMEVYK